MPLRDSGQNDVKISHTGRYAVFDSGVLVYRYDFVTHALDHCNWPDSNTAPSINDKGTKVLVGTAKGLYVCHFPDGKLVAHVDVFPTSAWTYQPQFEPAMSGDGQVVAYRGRNRGRFALFATVLPAGTPTKIADLGIEDSSRTTVMFSRNGTKLAYSDAQGRIWLASISVASFEGTVSDSQGSPLAAQGVSLKYAGATVAQDTTDASGSFALTAPSGSYTVGLSGSIGVPTSYKLSVPGIKLTREKQVALALPTRTVTVAVTGPTGAPISSAVVHLGTTPTSFPFLGGKASGTESANDATKKTGRVALEMLPAAAAKLTVTPPVSSGLAVATVSFVPTNGGVVHVRLKSAR